MEKKTLILGGTVVLLAIIALGAVAFYNGSSTGCFGVNCPNKEIKVALISSLSGDASVWDKE